MRGQLLRKTIISYRDFSKTDNTVMALFLYLWMAPHSQFGSGCTLFNLVCIVFRLSITPSGWKNFFEESLQQWSTWIIWYNINFCFLFCMFPSDVNECLADPSPCDASAACNNTNGSYTCTCKDGFTGNGTYCQGNQHFLLTKARVKHRTSHEPNRMQMRKPLCCPPSSFISIQFGSCKIRRLTWA